MFDLFSQIPTNTPLATLDTTGCNERNTFHWSRQAWNYAHVNPDYLTTNDLNRAHIKHWLAASSPSYNHFDILSLQQLPSPLADGSTEGPIIWYDYAGKTNGVSYEKGTQVQPAVVARVMADGSTASTYYTRDSFGRERTRTNTWMEWNGSAWALKTQGWSNVYSPIDGVDLLRTFGPNGNLLVGYGYGSPSKRVPTLETNALGEVSTRTYDSSVRLTSELTPAGLLRTNIYGGDGRLQSLVESTNGVTARTLGYSWLNGFPRTTTNELGLVITYTYDGLGRVLRELYPDGTGVTNVYSITTDETANGGVAPGTAIIEKCGTYDRLGNLTQYVYDNLRRLVVQLDPNGHKTVYTYCTCGSPASITRGADDPDHYETTTFDYDYQGHLLTTTYPDGSVVTNVFDSWGHTIAVLDALGGTTNTFDNLGRLGAVTNAFGQALK